jgi:hypothetical protein
MVALPAAAGLYGVPTNLSASGALTASSDNPPGWFILTGTDEPASAGDAVHQIRLFIEVTGNTLDILIFDPGNSGARDRWLGGTSSGTQTRYELRRPNNGTVLSSVTIGPDDTTTAGRRTDNRLVRFTPNNRGFYELDSTNARNISFSATHGMTPGLWELRITMVNAGTDRNAFGADIRVAKGSTTPYNAFTIGDSTAPATSFIMGGLNTGVNTPYAYVWDPTTETRQPAILFPYIHRGCTIECANFDSDITGSGVGATASILDVLGTSTPLAPLSDQQNTTSQVVTVERTDQPNFEITNYGVYALANDIGNQQFNFIDWRVADFSGWSSTPANLPWDPTNPIRMYLPNAYTPPVTTTSGWTAPQKPTLLTSVRVLGPVTTFSAGQNTDGYITASVDNPTGNPISNVQITVGLPSNVYYTGITECTVDGNPAPCTDSSSGNLYRRVTFTNAVPAGSVASLTFGARVTPASSGLMAITRPPSDGPVLPNNTSVWAQYTPTYSSTTYPLTEYLGPICQLTVDVGSGTAPTRASIIGLRVNPAGSVEFATGTQVNTVAFNVYGVQDPRRPAARVRLNQAPKRAPVMNSMTPILYRVETGPISTPYVYIEEIDGRGRRHLMGPFSIADQRLLEGFQRVEARLATAGAREWHGVRILSTARRERGEHAWTRHGHGRHIRSHSGVKMEVSRAGRVQVEMQELIANGLPRELASNPRELHLSSQGHAVHFRVLEDNGTPTAIEFLAEPASTAYTRRNVYVLTWKHKAPRPTASLTKYKEPRKQGMVRIEENWWPILNAPPETDPWFWDWLFLDQEGKPTESSRFAFDLHGPAEAQETAVPVDIRLYAITAHPHGIEAYINGVPAGRINITGSGLFTLRGSVPAGTVRQSGNELLLMSADAAGEAMDYLNYVELGIRLQPSAELIFPDRIAPYEPDLPRLAGTDYLIVTHPLFMEQANRIASAKSRQGHLPVVVDVENVYDAFSAGLVEANAIHELIKRWADGRGHDYVLLIGDDTFDYHGYYSESPTVFIPSLFGWDGEFGRVPSENRYADLNGDGKPDVAIGRLPVQTTDQADVLVNKIARQEQTLAENPARHLLASDNRGETDLDFSALARFAATFFPKGSTLTQVAPADASAARHTLLEALRQGVRTVHYFGHGHPEYWAEKGLLGVSDLDLTDLSKNLLANTFRETVVFSWTCMTQLFQYESGPSINEALLLTPDGGALASFGPAGITDPAVQALLMNWVYRKLTVERLPLGEAIRQAKARTISEHPESRPVVESWNLLGDPALRIPE